MGFLNPLALLLGAAVAVPLLLHLLQRQQGPRVIFPALRYLRRAEREHARKIRLRQILLLMLRVLVLLLIAAAAARPFLHTGGAGHVPTAGVIILDNSASTGAIVQDRRVLDVLKERAQETLLRAGPDDVFWLVRAGSSWEPAIRGDASMIADRVRETEPVAGAADLSGAVERAHTLLQTGAGQRAREIQLISDLQATNLRPIQRVESSPSVLIWQPEGDVPPNRGIAAVEVGGGLVPRTGERSTVAVVLAGNEAGDTTSVRVTIGNRVVAAGTGSTGAAALLTLPPQPEGLFSGHADIDADAFRADDRRYFAGRITPLPLVALTRPTPFVEEALTVLADAGRIRRGGIAAADVVIAPGGAQLAAAPGGASLVVLPPDASLELPALNSSLASAGVPWRYEVPTTRGEATIEATVAAGEALQRQLPAIRVRRTYPLRATGAAADSVLLRLSDGTPFAVRGQRPGGGTYVLLASPLADTSTTLPVTAAMVPLLDQLTGAWAAASMGSAEVVPGERIDLPQGASAVERPDGERDTLRLGETYRAPALPGIYRIFSGDSVRSVFVVNTPAIESDLNRADRNRVRASLPGWNVEFADSPGEWTRDIYHQRLGREVWGPLLWLLLLLLVIESLAAASGRRNNAAERNAANPAPADATT